MTKQRNDNYFSFPGFHGLSATTLKLIAIVTMFIDHFAVVFEARLDAAFPFLVMDDGLNVLRAVGRLAFPIFAFLIAEGAKKTHNIWLYLLRLGVFAAVSEVPFDLALFGTSFKTGVIEFEHQNVFFTLFLGLLSIALLQLLEKVHLAPLSFLFVLVFAYVAEELLKTDYGAMGVICIFLFYLFLQTNSKLKAVGIVGVCLLITVILSASVMVEELHYVSGRTGLMPEIFATARYNSYEIWSVAAAPLLILYNGKKGSLKINKFVFYAFYPAHLLLLWGVFVLFFAA